MDLPKLFVINLKRSIDRKKHMEKVCSTLPMDVEFVQAIDAKELKNEEITNDMIDVNGCIEDKNVGAILTKPTLCCALSHIKTWKLIQKQNLKSSFIMEDDIMIKDKESFLEILKKQDKFPKDWELVLFGHCEKGGEISLFHRKKILHNYKIVRYTSLVGGALGYLINQKGVYKLLNQVYPIRMPIDYYTGNDRIVNIYGVEPAVIEEKSYFESRSVRQKSSMTEQEHKEYYKHLEKYKNKEKQEKISSIQKNKSWNKYLNLLKNFRLFNEIQSIFIILVKSINLHKYKR